MTELAIDGGLAADVETIGQRAGRGFRWSVAGTLAGKLGSFVLGIALAHLLTKSDFGMYAVALAALQLGMMLNDVGVIAATVQWRGALDEMTPTASAVALTSSVAMYALFWVAAPWYASVAGNADAAPIVRLLMVVVVIDGITAVRAGLLMRTFRQDQITIANVAGLVANAALAITLAISGAGAAAFAGGMVAGSVVTGGIMVLYARLPFRLGFDRSVALRLMRFGLPLAASLGLEAIVLNADFIIVGHEAGATQLGYYLLAFNISSWALGILIASVRHVSIAGFSRLSEMGEESVSAGVHRSLPVLFMLIAPVGALTATLARPLVVSVYGRSWAPAAPVLAFLAILTVARVLVSFIADIVMSHGKTRAILLINIAWGLVLVPGVYLGVRLDGIRGVGIAHALACPLVALPLSLLALRRVGVKLAPLVPALVRPALGAALSTVVAVAVTRVADVPLVELALGGILGLLVYGLVAVPGSTWRRWMVAAGSRVSSARRSAHADV